MHLMVIRLFVASLILLGGLAKGQPGEAFDNEFKEVVIDLRNSRGGNGDVAAGYLTLMSLLFDYKVKSHITLLVDDEAQKRLNTLLSDNHPLPENVEIQRPETIDRQRPIELYLAMASPSGTLKNKPFESLNFAPNAVLLIQTVLGNTENPHSLNPKALIQVGDTKIDMDPAGIGSNEAGIYGDYIAQTLRGQSEDFARQFLFAELDTVVNDGTRQQLRTLINKQSLQGSQTGLVYGITSGQTRPQFTSYLKGLSQFTEKSFCLITPSKFDLKFIDDPSLRERIVVLNEHSALPAIAEPGKIYILTTPNLPHPVFVGLTYLSMKQGVTPVGAGDGFMSAGIILGEPFVLTRVPWNENNILNLKNQLRRQWKKDSDALDELLYEIYENINFEKALELQNYRSLFTELSANTPRLTENIISAAVGVHRLASSGTENLNKHTLKRLGLTLQGAKRPQTESNDTKVYTDFIKDSVSSSTDMPQSVKDKILNYYKTLQVNKLNPFKANSMCSRLFVKN